MNRNLFSLILIVSLNADCLSILCKTRWKRISLKNYLIADYIEILNVTSAEKCGEMCLNVEDCKSFGISSVYTEYMECILYSHRVWNKRILKYYEGLSFYWLLEDTCPTSKGFVHLKSHGMCLKIITSSRNWTEALDLCEHCGGHLAIVDSFNKSSSIANIFQVTTDFFIGGVKFSTHFIWMNSVKISSNWADFYPKLATNKCVGVSWPTSKLKNFYCGDAKPALCEIPMS